MSKNIAEILVATIADSRDALNQIYMIYLYDACNMNRNDYVNTNHMLRSTSLCIASLMFLYSSIYIYIYIHVYIYIYTHST